MTYGIARTPVPMLALKILKNACAEDVLFSCSTTSAFSLSTLLPFPRSGDVDREITHSENICRAFFTDNQVVSS